MTDKIEKNTVSPALSLLETIEGPCDVKRIARQDLPKLAEEIRGEIIRVVTANGGHLASSLGVVELIIALHYVLKAPMDKIIYDVGHQAYAHKILTGRRAEFETIRRENGLAGFPKRAESLYDDFDTGHASTSVSAALGLACARDLAGEDHAVVAVIGDGALTGGMVMEALNHAGALKKKLIIILNDNKMSISRNVGGFSEYLSLLLTKPGYIRLRKKIKHGLHQYMPGRGGRVVDFIRRLEESLKGFFTSPSAMFEAVGFKYLGPFDGHDVGLLIDGLTGATNLDRPVLMHVVTTKGKGFSLAEDDPTSYHGVGMRRQAEVGEVVAEEPQLAPKKNFCDVFGQALVEEARGDERVVAVTAAMSEGTGLSPFFEEFPSRSFDVGIAEQHAVTLSAGLAAGGLRPVVAIYSTFLQRAFDQLFHDVALQNLPVVVAVDRAGLVGEDGETHHGGLDLSYLRLLPNFTVMAPADGDEVAAMLHLGLSLPGPSAIRYPRGAAPASISPGEVRLGRGQILREGHDLAILTLGWPTAEALAAAETLASEGIQARVVNLRFIKPLDEKLILESAQKTGAVLTVEENSKAGGLFGAVSEMLANTTIKLNGLGLTDEPVHHASQKSQRAKVGLDRQGICRAARELVGRGH